MRKWNASMPKQKAAKGGANVVLAFRLGTGERVELEAKMSAECAQAIMRQAIESMKSYKGD